MHAARGERAIRAFSLLLALVMVVPLFAKPQAIGRQELLTGPFLDKIAHGSYYGIIGAALDRGLSTRSMVPALLSVAVIGAADEINQRRIPGRSADFLDWCADAIGAALLLRWRRRARSTG